MKGKIFCHVVFKVVFLLVGILLSVFFMQNSGFAQNKWYERDLSQNGQIYVADFLLKSGEIKTVELNSENGNKVGFNVDITVEEQQQYVKKNIMPFEAEYSIQKKDTIDNSITVASSAGASFVPEEGKIVSILVRNNSDKDFNIVVYTQ